MTLLIPPNTYPRKKKTKNKSNHDIEHIWRYLSPGGSQSPGSRGEVEDQGPRLHLPLRDNNKKHHQSGNNNSLRNQFQIVDSTRLQSRCLTELESPHGVGHQGGH